MRLLKSSHFIESEEWGPPNPTTLLAGVVVVLSPVVWRWAAVFD